jgi:hypothetical protein
MRGWHPSDRPVSRPAHVDGDAAATGSRTVGPIGQFEATLLPPAVTGPPLDRRATSAKRQTPQSILTSIGLSCCDDPATHPAADARRTSEADIVPMIDPSDAHRCASALPDLALRRGAKVATKPP